MIVCFTDDTYYVSPTRRRTATRQNVHPNIFLPNLLYPNIHFYTSS